MDINDKFNQVLKYNKERAENFNNKINNLKLKLANSQKDSRAYEVYSQQIRDNERSLQQMNDIIEFMRPRNDIDVASRIKILSEFPSIVNEIFPDGFPIVFHGTSNIGTVRKILKTGGLLTPEQRNESMTSNATLIDVTYKSNIRVSCQFADEGNDYFMPYGAIFAFKPEENEIKRVVSTGSSSEVEKGVNGVNFRKEPRRLFGIITTPENIERVKKWCKQYDIDPNNVFTHNKFIEKFKELNINIEN